MYLMTSMCFIIDMCIAFVNDSIAKSQDDACRCWIRNGDNLRLDLHLLQRHYRMDSLLRGALFQLGAALEVVQQHMEHRELRESFQFRQHYNPGQQFQCQDRQ